MTHEENDHWDRRLIAVMATLLLRGQIETFNGIEVGGRRKTKIAVAVTWAEEILACVHQRASNEQVDERIEHAADNDEPFGRDCPLTVEEPKGRP